MEDPYPYGISALEVLDSRSDELLVGAGINSWNEELTDQDTDLRIRYLGRERYAMEQEIASNDLMDAHRDAWLETDQ